MLENNHKKQLYFVSLEQPEHENVPLWLEPPTMLLTLCSRLHETNIGHMGTWWEQLFRIAITISFSSS